MAKSAPEHRPLAAIAIERPGGPTLLDTQHKELLTSFTQAGPELGLRRREAVAFVINCLWPCA